MTEHRIGPELLYTAGATKDRKANIHCHRNVPVVLMLNYVLDYYDKHSNFVGGSEDTADCQKFVKTSFRVLLCSMESSRCQGHPVDLGIQQRATKLGHNVARNT